MRDSRLNEAAVETPVRPFAVGDQVTVWGLPAEITETAYSRAVEESVLTVEFSNRIRLRVGASTVERSEQV